MLIVEYVDRDGRADGYVVNGPPHPNSYFQTPPNHKIFKGRISGHTLSFHGVGGDYLASMTFQSRIAFKALRPSGGVGVVSLNPVWTLIEAESAASSGAAKQPGDR